jgi:hypothetical protein
VHDGWVPDASFDFEPFGFSSSYQVVVEPEFPGTGDWGGPTYGFARDGSISAEFESRWGAPLVLSVHADEVGDWIAMFAAGGLGGERGAFACPKPSDLCVVADGQAYLVDAAHPEKGAIVVHNMVVQVLPVADMSLLLLVRPWDLVAIGARGIAWRTPRLAVDGLRVLTAAANSIICSCDNLGGSETISLDPQTGEQTAGTRLDSFWPPDAIA